MHKPALHAVHDLHYGGLVFRAGLSELVAGPTCSPEPVLRAELDLAPAWWTSLRTDLNTIAEPVILDWEGFGAAPSATTPPCSTPCPSSPRPRPRPQRSAGNSTS
nr:hypothetical protein [Streptomyces sp. S1D4-11]QIY94019.1 hypothetical protein HEP87_08090 [Streptomyces sp. S1D4-11]